MIEQPQPSLWQLESIDRLCHEIKNVDPQRMFGNDVFRYIDISSVDNQQKKIVEVQEISGLKAPSRARQQIRGQDVLVSTVRPALNAVAIVPDELDGEICSTGFCVLRPKQELIDPDYLFAWVRHPLFVTSLVRLERGIGYPAVSDDDVRHSSIPLPPLPEQGRIVAILRKADELRQLRRQANARAQQLLPALFDEMFGQEAVKRQGWPQKSIFEIGEVSYGLTVNQQRRISNKQYPYLRVANVYRWELDLSEISEIGVLESDLEKYTLQKGDVLVVEGHGDPSQLGRASAWNDEIEPVCLHQNHLLRIRPYLSEITPNFLVGYLNSRSGTDYMLRYGKTSSGLNTINSKVLGDMPIFHPPLEIQQEFERKYQRYVRIVDDCEESAQKFDTLFQSFLVRAFSGELTAAWREAHAAELTEAAAERDRLLGQPIVVHPEPITTQAEVYEPVVTLTSARAIYADLDAATQSLLAAAQTRPAYFRAADLLNGNGLTAVQAETGLRVLAALGFVREVALDGQLFYRRVDPIGESAPKPEFLQ